MIAVSFQSLTAYLLDDRPSWTEPVELTAELPAHAEGGVTQREARTPLADTLRLGLRYNCLLDDEAVPAFRNALQALTTERILCPLWPALIEAGSTPIVLASYYVCIDDSGDAPEIKTHAELPFSRDAYPLLIGRFERRPSLRQPAGDLAVADISFIENDAWSITPPLPLGGIERDDDTGAVIYSDDYPQLNGRLLFPFRPNWSNAPGTDVDVALQRANIGAGRTTADQYFAQPAIRGAKQFFTLDAAEPWQLLAFFLNCGGVQKSFWLPSGIADAKLTAAVAAVDTTLTVEDSSTVGDNRFLLIDDLSIRTPVQVSSLPSGTSLQLTAPVGNAYGAGDRLESLMLARFKTTRLTFRFNAGDLAGAAIEFRELPWEDETVAGETEGTTIGALPVSAYLYEFLIDYGDAQTYFRFTDFERDLSYSSNTFTARPSALAKDACWIEHGPIVETDNLQRQEVSLKSRRFSGNPLNLFLPLQLEWPLQLDIYEVTISNGAIVSAERVFSGEVDDAKYAPPLITARASSLGALFERNIPIELIQPGCNATLFDNRCALLRADWKWTGLVTSYDSATGALVLNTVTRVLADAIALASGRFAGGMLIAGSGSTAQRRMIAGNTALVGSDITLTVATPFTTAPSVGSTITFHPGCPGRYQEDCIGFFNNGPRFRGFPFMPLANPSFANIRETQSTGGKK